MDTLIIPLDKKITFETYPDFTHEGHACTRIEYEWEAAYWYTDGTNDIMQGEKGTLLEAAQALINFASAPQCGDYPAPCNCDDPTTHNGH